MHVNNGRLFPDDCSPTEKHRRSTARVHPQELSVELARHESCGIPGAPATLGEVFRHSGWKHAREAVYRALLSTRQSVSRIARFSTCGESAWLLQSVIDPAHFRMATNGCHDKLCLPCAADRSRVITHNMIERMAGKGCRFVTLTMKGGESCLQTGIRRLLACFRRLRQRRVWSARVTGGAAFVEFTWSPNQNGWHVHLHIVCQGRYFPKADLESAWLAVTGDSYICDIKFVRDEGKVARYVAKYVTKPWDASDVRAQDRMPEIVTATHRQRLVFCFGDWIGMPLTAQPSDGEWQILGDLQTVCGWALEGDETARLALASVMPDDTALLWGEIFGAPQHPPPACRPIADQLTFTWRAIDNRF